MTDARRASRNTDSAGFTLIELMVALVIISIGILALSGVQTRTSRDVHSTGRGTRALALAEQQIEIARSGGYSGAVSDSGLVAPFGWLTRVDSVDVELRRVMVTVTWQELSGPKTLQLQTLLAAR